MGTTLIDDRKTSRVALKRLPTQQRFFVLEMLASKMCHPVDAARAAGYKFPNQAANKLMKNKKIKAILGKAQQERATRLNITADRVLEELAHLAFRDVADLCNEEGKVVVDSIGDLPERIRRCIDGIKCKQYTYEDGTTVQEIELRLVGKLGALELVAKHLGMLAAQRHEIKQVVDWQQLYEDQSNKGNGDDTLLLEGKILEGSE